MRQSHERVLPPPCGDGRGGVYLPRQSRLPFNAGTRRRTEPWVPNATEEAWLEVVHEALADLDASAEQPVSARQIYYRLTFYGYPKTHRASLCLGALIAHARYYDRLDWHLIRDDTRLSKEPSFYDSPEDFREYVELLKQNYRIDRQQGQPVRIEVRVEANGMLPAVANLCREYSIGVYANGGSAGHTTLYEAAERINARDMPTVILVVGDLDTAGGHIKSNVEEFLRYTVEPIEVDLALSDEESLTVERPAFTYIDVAVTPEQVERYGLPSDPENPGQVQAEALTPAQLQAELRAAIEQHIDHDAYERVVRREAAERATL